MVAPKLAAMLAGLVALALPASACSSTGSFIDYGAASGAIVAVGAENQYADVIAQVGGKYVKASAIMSNPSTDPHTFEASASVARLVSGAQLVVQNGLGYDAFMNTIENAAPSGSERKVIVVQHLLGLPDGTPNPHLWYKPEVMASVALTVAKDLAAIQPAHAGYFEMNAADFVESLGAWQQAIAGFKAKYAGTPVATTEPVADYLLQALGAVNRTPWAFQAAVMNRTDPSAQDMLLLSSLSPDLAAARGVPVRAVGAAYLMALAVSVALSAVIIGSVLSTALLIGPAATALRLARDPVRAGVLAAGIGVAATWLGVLLAYDSYYWPPSGRGWPVSFFVVTLIVAGYLLSYLRPPRRRAATDAQQAPDAERACSPA